MRRWTLPAGRVVTEIKGTWTFYDGPGRILHVTSDPAVALALLDQLLPPGTSAKAMDDMPDPR